jgi:hypothetical protein
VGLTFKIGILADIHSPSQYSDLSVVISTPFIPSGGFPVVELEFGLEFGLEFDGGDPSPHLAAWLGEYQFPCNSQ